MIDKILFFVIISVMIWAFWTFYLKHKVKIRSYIEEQIDSLMPILFIAFLGIFSNVNIGLWTIIITIIVFLGSESQKRLKYWEKQENILRQINEEVEYLISEDGHINYFRKCVKPKGYPHHNISELNLNFYLTSLASKLNSKPTLVLINKLKKANDKIKMLNDYRKDGETWSKMQRYINVDMGYGGYLLDVLNELEKNLREIQKIINELLR